MPNLALKPQINVLKNGERPQQRPPKTHMKNTIYFELTGGA